MGQNFGRILIKQNEVNSDLEVNQVLLKINDQFEKDKEGLTYIEFLDEKWNRGSEGLIGFFYNQKIIIIEDEYNLLNDDFLKDTSELLNTEIAKVTNSDTAGISMIQIYDNGALIRMKSFGLEDDLDMLSEEELKSVEGIGTPTIYEQNGSDANNVFHAFITGKVESSEINDITIFREK